VNLKPLVTHSFSLDDVSEAFKTFQERIGGAIKVVVTPNGVDEKASRRST
jgi:threonine dehydrogenase-like Zn-dependent dehydrogenase